MEERIDKLRLGSVMAPTPEGYISPVDCGSMISKDRFKGLERYLKDAEEAGARVYGGKEYDHVYQPEGSYLRPGLVGPVDSRMEIAKHERTLHRHYLHPHLTCFVVFAPIALIMPYETTDEAIAIANSTKYGLGASVFGPYQEDCIEVAKQLECGMVSINDFGVFYVRSLHFCLGRSALTIFIVEVNALALI
jgi:acyl-CoA reductase-like NAD-dependent aldehyde dehydrogenase